MKFLPQLSADLIAGVPVIGSFLTSFSRRISGGMSNGHVSDGLSPDISPGQVSEERNPGSGPARSRRAPATRDSRSRAAEQTRRSETFGRYDRFLRYSDPVLRDLIRRAARVVTGIPHHLRRLRPGYESVPALRPPRPLPGAGAVGRHGPAALAPYAVRVEMGWGPAVRPGTRPVHGGRPPLSPAEMGREFARALLAELALRERSCGRRLT
jgi:hypothetical protein